jgi:hypothetical protein
MKERTYGCVAPQEEGTAADALFPREKAPKYSDNIAGEFSKALRRICSITGLKDLSLIEKVTLKRILAECCAMADNTKSLNDKINPYIEATAIFMQSHYDIPFATQNDICTISDIRQSVREKTGTDGLAQYFRNRQDEKHLL